MNFSRRELLQWGAVSLAPAVWPAVSPGRGLLAQTPPQAAGQAPATGQAPAAPPKTEFVDVRRNVSLFTGQGGAIGLLVNAGGVAVIDTQFPLTAQICLDGLKTRANGRGVDLVINTHHHGDHTGGNAVFRPAAKKIVAHANVPELQKAAAARQANAPAPTLPDTTFPDTFRAPLGDEVISAKYYGPAHTSGDIVVFFEKANVVHMGDLTFNRRHPFIDRPAGASIAGWITLLEAVTKAHANDTIFIFGHAGDGWKVTGTKADLLVQRDYFTELLTFVRAEVKAGKPKEEIIKTNATLKGFTDHGPLIERVTTVAYDEVTASA
jgi:cyclase